MVNHLTKKTMKCYYDSFIISILKLNKFYNACILYNPPNDIISDDMAFLLLLYVSFILLSKVAYKGQVNWIMYITIYKDKVIGLSQTSKCLVFKSPHSMVVIVVYNEL